MSQTAATPQPPPEDNYAVFRIRDFRLYLSGRLVAVFGQQMLTVAVGWELYDRTGSALALGFVGLSEMIAMVLLTLPAGHTADNFNRKRIVMTALGVSSCASLGLTLISWTHAPVYFIYACLFTAAAARTFLWPASTAFLTSLVPRHLFPRAVTWNSGTFQLSSVAGPAASGALIALLKKYSPHPAAFIYLFNMLAALTCFTTIALVHSTHRVAKREDMTLSSLAAGFKFVFSSRIILGTITLDMFAVLLGGATALLPVFAKDILHAGPGGLGILQAALPLGSFSCALFLAHRPPMEKAGRALLWAVVVFGLATIGFGLANNEGLGRWLNHGTAVSAATWFWVAFAMLYLCGAVDNVSVVVRHTLVQLLTPDEKRGRVSAVNSLFIGTSNELGGFESGTTAHLFGPMLGNTIALGAVLSVVVGGIGTILVVAGVAWCWPEIRKYGRLDGS
ncbi:MAG TPA: MFS transporter [Dongiaceae bacterium]|jgi:MFS family permease|nr:MFS transporter [Dongiaceae bacterium]